MAVTPDWMDITRRASFASHRLIGWIFWDPGARDHLAALGVPDGIGHYIVNRAAPLAAAGAEAVTAAFFSIKREFVEYSLAHAAPHVDWHAVTEARDAAVRSGLERMAPDIIGPLGDMAADLWRIVDDLPVGGRVLFAAHKSWPRPADPAVSAWNALNTIREWRGDTHWAILIADGLEAVEAGLLHDAWMGYPKEWIPRSRGANDDEIARALHALTKRGFARDGVVTADGVAHRQSLEDRTDELCVRCWHALGEARCRELLDLLEPVGDAFLAHIDATAGDHWMPAARTRR